MGMFDHIKCNVKLPKKANFVKSDDHEYQTKDLDCDCSSYEIRQEGLFGPDGKIENHPSEIDFYDSNTVMYANGYSFTRDGEDDEFVSYKAVLSDGKLSTIILDEYTSEVSLSSSDYWRLEKELPKPVKNQFVIPGIGQEFFRAFGSPGSFGFSLEKLILVAITDKDICYRDSNGRLGVVEVSFSHSLFNSKHELAAFDDAMKERYQKIKERLAGMLADKVAARSQK
jgi:hypothetical protein